MFKVMKYIEDNMFKDPTLFAAIKLEEGSNEDRILFVIQQLRRERDLAYDYIDKKEKKNASKR